MREYKSLSVNVMAEVLLTDVFGLVPSPNAPNDNFVRLVNAAKTSSSAGPEIAVEVNNSFVI